MSLQRLYRLETAGRLCHALMPVGLLLTTAVILCSCNTRHAARGTSLRQSLLRKDFREAERILSRSPSLVNGEFVTPSSFEDDDTGKTSFTEGHPLIAWFAADLDVVKWLLGKGAIINLRANGKGDSALHIAARGGNLSVVKLLVKKGATLRLEDSQAHTPLLGAVLNRRFDVALFLISSGHSINFVNSLGRTVLDSVLDEMDLIGGGSDFGGQKRVAELRIVEAWIRKQGGKRHIELARRWVKETSGGE